MGREEPVLLERASLFRKERDKEPLKEERQLRQNRSPSRKKNVSQINKKASMKKKGDRRLHGKEKSNVFSEGEMGKVTGSA